MNLTGAHLDDAERRVVAEAVAQAVRRVENIHEVNVQVLVDQITALKNQLVVAQEALDKSEARRMRMIDQGDEILDGVRKLLSSAGYARHGSD